MSKSLQDQLLALGLAKQEARQSRPKQERRKPPIARPAGRGQHAGAAHKGPAKSGTSNPVRPDLKNDENISLEQAYRLREAQEKSAKQKARERKMEEDRKRAAINKQIRQVIDAGRLNLADASEARYFMYKERIRKVHVSSGQLQEINSGALGVVYLAGGYHILSMDQVEEVRKLSPSHVPDLLAGGSDDDFDEAELLAADSGEQTRAEDENTENPE